MVGAQYILHCKLLPGTNGKTLSSKSLQHKLLAIESLHRLLENTQYSFCHPWPDNSASTLSSYKQSIEGNTALISDTTANLVMRHCVELLKNSDHIFSCRELMEKDKKNGLSYEQRSARMIKKGFTLVEFRKALKGLQDACMFIILMATGIRAHELISLETGCGYTTEDDAGDRLHWIKGISTKTAQGETEWLCPELCHQAIKITEKIAQPHQTALEMKIANTTCPAEHQKLLHHAKKLFLRKCSSKGNKIGTISVATLGYSLKDFVNEIDETWNFSPHQCRRTFAVYVVGHILGDLRYLRNHYKHWTLDMTAMYAANQAQDRELYDEIFLEMMNYKQAKVSHWLAADTQLAGGVGKPNQKCYCQSQINKANRLSVTFTFCIKINILWKVTCNQVDLKNEYQ